MSSRSWGDNNNFVLWAASQSISSLANRACGCRTPPVSAGRARCPFAASSSVPSCRRSSAFAEKQSSSAACVINTSSHIITAPLQTRAESRIHGCQQKQGFDLSPDFQICSVEPTHTYTHTCIIHGSERVSLAQIVKTFLSYLPGARYLIKIIIST